MERKNKVADVKSPKKIEPVKKTETPLEKIPEKVKITAILKL
jgi:hypothetical protein